MRDVQGAIEHHGARLVVIGNGAPAFMAPFRKQTGFMGEILTDPSLKAFEAAGLTRSLFRVVDPRAGLAAARALAKGFRQGATEGDAWQQGGVLIVRPGGELAWAYASRFAGDHPEPAEILAALAPAPVS